MINANELRIGNIVEIDRGIGKVVMISTEEYSEWNDSEDFNVRVEVNGIYYSCSENELSPILLTEEILLKCGYNLVYSSRFTKSYEHSELPKMKYKYKCLGNCGFIYYQNTCIMCIESLHQLQNLYFTITGKELTVNI